MLLKSRFGMRATLAAALAASALLVGCGSTTTASVAGGERQQLMLVSEAEMNQMAQQYFAQQNAEARAQNALITSGAEYNRVLAIMRRLVPQTGIFRQDAPRWQWQFALINSPDVNAHAMPGGKITFFTGLVRKLKLSDDEIAVVMGHEMAHAIREHSREKASQQKAGSLALQLGGSLLGANATQMKLATLGKQLALDLPFSRTMENEADAIGLEITARGGYNPNAATSLWGKMEAESGGSGPSFLSTHPTSAQRKANINALIPKMMPLYEGARATRGKGRKRG